MQRSDTSDVRAKSIADDITKLKTQSRISNIFILFLIVVYLVLLVYLWIII